MAVLTDGERKKELVPVSVFEQAIDELAGATLVALSGIPARLLPYDIPERRRCESIIFAVRKELAAKALRRAEEVETTEEQSQWARGCP